MVFCSSIGGTGNIISIKSLGYSLNLDALIPVERSIFLNKQWNSSEDSPDSLKYILFLFADIRYKMGLLLRDTQDARLLQPKATWYWPQ